MLIRSLQTLAGLMAAAVGGIRVEAQTRSDDLRAMSVIFAEQHVSESAWYVHRRAKAMPLDRRYAYLVHWVLPADGVRLTLTLTPTHPAPLADLVSTADRERLAMAARIGQRRVQTGGSIVSPALDLIDAAARRGRLEDLLRRVDGIPPNSDIAQRAQLAFRTLVLIAQRDFEAANAAIVNLSACVPGIGTEDTSDRTALTLVSYVAVQHSETREAANELLAGVHSQVQHHVRTGNDAWDQHLFMLPGLARCFDELDDGSSRFALAPRLKQWSPASWHTAQTRGEGRPLAHWQFIAASESPASAPRIDSRTGHHRDYLYFQSPLQDDFEVECDVTAGDWSEGHLLIGGCWVAPFHNDEFTWGTLREEFPRRTIPPRRPTSTEWMHYRASVHDGRLSVFFDGHRVFEQQLPPDHDPWIAIRSRSEHQTGVRDLRISGKPVVPTELRLSTSESLTGWAPYFDESIGGRNADWKCEGGVISGRHRTLYGPGDGAAERVLKPGTPGTGVESLLQYHRPMLEDGEIEYEFFYEPDVAAAHPALDRLVLLVNGDGVCVHWLTDGLHDRAGAHPLNSHVEPESRRGPKRLPLIERTWNRATLALSGDTLRLAVNGVGVFERAIEPSNQRQFGLFHYADAGEARVRNVVWRGNWPRSLPAVAQQELADTRVQRLDARSAELPNVFVHNFETEGLPKSQFQCSAADAVSDVQVRGDGLLVGIRGGEGWVEHNLSGIFRISGDFDLSATFESLQMQADETSDGAALLLHLICPGETDDQYYIGRRLYEHDHQIVETMHNWRRPGDSRAWRSQANPQASRGGTFRVVRHGERMLFLFAEGRSRQFRIVDEQRAVRGDIPLHGVRLLTQASGNGTQTRVTWKSLSVRAERIDGLLPGDPEKFVAELNRRRESLAGESFDFAKQELAGGPFAPVGAAAGNIRSTDAGLHAAATGGKQFTATTLELKRRLRGDFDVSVDFRILRSDLPAESDNSGVWLQLRSAGESGPIYNLLAATFPNQRRVVHAMTERSINNRHVPTPIADAENPTANRLRYVRRGSTLYLLYGDSDANGDRMLTTETIGSEDVPSGDLLLMVHPGGPGRRVEVVWQHVRICAEEIGHE